jgi:hypothetical protein
MIVSSTTGTQGTGPDRPAADPCPRRRGDRMSLSHCGN